MNTVFRMEVWPCIRHTHYHRVVAVDSAGGQVLLFEGSDCCQLESRLRAGTMGVQVCRVLDPPDVTEVCSRPTAVAVEPLPITASALAGTLLDMQAEVAQLRPDQALQQFSQQLSLIAPFFAELPDPATESVALKQVAYNFIQGTLLRENSLAETGYRVVSRPLDTAGVADATASCPEAATLGSGEVRTFIVPVNNYSDPWRVSLQGELEVSLSTAVVMCSAGATSPVARSLPLRAPPPPAPRRAVRATSLEGYFSLQAEQGDST